MSELNLWNHGIQTSEADLWVHVGVACRMLLAYPRENALVAVQQYHPRAACAGQKGVRGATARGYLVRPEDIIGLVTIPMPFWPGWDEFRLDMETNEKGALAEAAFADAAEKGRVPMRFDVVRVTDRAGQRRGVDQVLTSSMTVEVKCDWRAGPKPKGSGNLFIQVAERNPRRLF